MVDLHSHLIPGVDDGATSLDEALLGLRRMRGEGVTTVVCTPHLSASLVAAGNGEYREYRDQVHRAFQRLSAGARAILPEMILVPAFEVAVDLPDPDFSDPGLRIGGGRFVLMEWPGLRVPPGTPQVLSRIRSQGVHPVIAHPERYRGVDDPMRMAEAWKEAGALLQVNHGSLLGRYGPQARENSFVLLRAGLVDYLSSDYHGRGGMSTYVSEARELLLGLGAGGHWDLLARMNPGRLVADEPPLSGSPLPQEGWVSRIIRLVKGSERQP